MLLIYSGHIVAYGSQKSWFEIFGAHRPHIGGRTIMVQFPWPYTLNESDYVLDLEKRIKYASYTSTMRNRTDDWLLKNGYATRVN